MPRLPHLRVLASIFCGLTLVPSMSYAKTADATPPAQTAATDANAFATDLYGRLAPTQGNVFFSPYSVSSALAMTYAGARGDTAKQMADVLRFTQPPDALHASWGQLIANLNKGGTIDGHPVYELAVANALWGQKGYPYQRAYLELVGKNYEAAVHQVDYLHAAEAARLEINAWVAKQTKDRIKDLLSTGDVTEMTRLVLVNAIYFKAAWAEPFRKENTKDAPFHVDAGKDVTVSMMHQQHSFGYAETDDLQVVDLPYLGGKLSMIVLLPKKADGLPALEKQLSPQAFEQWTANLAGRQVRLDLPKFTMTRQFELGKVLKAMGMTLAFTNKADFSGIATPEPLQISDVIHKAFVEVNEAGTEAAAATAVVMRAGAIRQEAPPAVFRADHPFLFYIRDRESKAILFLGRVTNPKE